MKLPNLGGGGGPPVSLSDRVSLKGCRLSRADAISAGAAADLCMLDMPPATTFAGLGSSRRSPWRRAKRRISCRKSQSTLLKRPWHRRRRRRHRVLRAPRRTLSSDKENGRFRGRNACRVIVRVARPRLAKIGRPACGLFKNLSQDSWANPLLFLGAYLPSGKRLCSLENCEIIYPCCRLRLSKSLLAMK